MSKGFVIAAQGGGMISAYHAGVIRALHERFGFEDLHAVAASSGAAAIYTYLASDQEQHIEPIWDALMRSKKFVLWKQHPLGSGILNIDFLVDEMIKKQFPLDVPALRKSSIQMNVGVTDSETGQPHFFSQHSNVDYHELIRASCAVPYFYGKHVSLDGRLYCDGSVGSPVSLEPLAGQQNILIVMTRPAGPFVKLFTIRKILQWFMIRHEPQALQEAIWTVPARFEQAYRDMDALAARYNVAVIAPQQKLSQRRIDPSLLRMHQTIDQGYRDAMSHTGLEEFFRKVRT